MASDQLKAAALIAAAQIVTARKAQNSPNPEHKPAHFGPTDYRPTATAVAEVARMILAEMQKPDSKTSAEPIQISEATRAAVESPENR